MKYKILSFFTIFILLLQSFVYSTTSYVWSSNNNSVQTNAETSKDLLNIESGSAILIEQKTGKILYEKNSHEKLRPASVTKIMSILLIMEALDSGEISLTDKVPCSENASSMGGSQIWLEQKEQLTVDEMLKAICVVSANDCVVAMAEFLSGSEENFVQKMNQKASTLGMKDTCFKNCHGIDEDGHVTSSYDISIMSKELLNNHPTIVKYTTIWMDSLRNGASQLTNTNKLVRTYEGCTGLKTGSTSLALYNLSASATRGDLSLIAVIMRAPTTQKRFSEAKSLLDYGFNNYEFCKLADKSNVLQTIPISKATISNIDIVFEKDCGILIKKGQSKKITQEIIIDQNISAPLNKGNILGKINYYLDDTLLDSVNLITNENISKKNIFSNFNFISKYWINLTRK